MVEVFSRAVVQQPGRCRHVPSPCYRSSPRLWCWESAWFSAPFPWWVWVRETESRGATKPWAETLLPASLTSCRPLLAWRIHSSCKLDLHLPAAPTRVRSASTLQRSFCRHCCTWAQLDQNIIFSFFCCQTSTASHLSRLYLTWLPAHSGSSQMVSSTSSSYSFLRLQAYLKDIYSQKYQIPDDLHFTSRPQWGAVWGAAAPP